MSTSKREPWGRSRKLPSGRWQARYPGPDGQTYTARTAADKPLTFVSKADARTWLAATHTLIARGEWQPPSMLAAQRREEADRERARSVTIGSNDMTQLTLGLDRDSGLVAATFDERDPAVLKMLSMAINACRRAGKYVGICGQGPSDHPDLAEWLVDQGIESMSLNPDTVVDTWLRLAATPSPARIR